jgi:hypothetical protein
MVPGAVTWVSSLFVLLQKACARVLPGMPVMMARQVSQSARSAARLVHASTFMASSGVIRSRTVQHQMTDPLPQPAHVVGTGAGFKDGVRGVRGHGDEARVFQRKPVPEGILHGLECVRQAGDPRHAIHRDTQLTRFGGESEGTGADFLVPPGGLAVNAGPVHDGFPLRQ